MLFLPIQNRSLNFITLSRTSAIWLTAASKRAAVGLNSSTFLALVSKVFTSMLPRVWLLDACPIHVFVYLNTLEYIHTTLTITNQYCKYRYRRYSRYMFVYKTTSDWLVLLLDWRNKSFFCYKKTIYSKCIPYFLLSVHVYTVFVHSITGSSVILILNTVCLKPLFRAKEIQNKQILSFFPRLQCLYTISLYVVEYWYWTQCVLSFN